MDRWFRPGKTAGDLGERFRFQLEQVSAFPLTTDPCWIALVSNGTDPSLEGACPPTLCWTRVKWQVKDDLSPPILKKRSMNFREFVVKNSRKFEADTIALFG
jgi:hypothetical protein